MKTPSKIKIITRKKLKKNDENRRKIKRKGKRHKTKEKRTNENIGLWDVINAGQGREDLQMHHEQQLQNMCRIIYHR